MMQLGKDTEEPEGVSYSLEGGSVREGFLEEVTRELNLLGREAVSQ